LFLASTNSKSVFLVDLNLNTNEYTMTPTHSLKYFIFKLNSVTDFIQIKITSIIIQITKEFYSGLLSLFLKEKKNADVELTDAVFLYLKVPLCWRGT
jgi:hypothetical protein